MRISLRELMIVVAVAAIGMAGLKYASSGMLPIVQAMTGILLVGFLVRAVVDRGSRQAFAIGFVICGLGYALGAQLGDDFRVPTPVSGPESAFTPTLALVAIAPSNTSPQWLDVNANQLLDFDPTDPFEFPIRPFALGHVSPPQTAPFQITFIEGANIIINAPDLAVVSWIELFSDGTLKLEEICRAAAHAAGRETKYAYQPTAWPKDFLFVGHCLGTLLVGYVGGQFSQFAYRRRRGEQVALESS